MSDTGSMNPSAVKNVANDNCVTFKITNQEDGTPLGGVHVSVIFSDGRPDSKNTLDNGEVNFEHIPSGACDLDECKKDHIFLEKNSDYTLQDQDTLESIAKDEQAKGNDITWDDIAAFNWGEESRKKTIANEHMRDELGCTDYNGTQDQMVYTAGNTTHTLIIPKKIRRKGLAINTLHEIKVGPKETPPQFLSCCGIPNINFSLNDSFIRPSAKKYLKKLKEKINEHPDAKLMVFGHTDKVGDEKQNKRLSEHRAKSAFSLLTKNPDYWVTLYKYSASNPDNENWGVKSVQTILNYLNPDAHLDLSDTLDDRTIKEIETIVKPAWEQTHFGKRIPDNSLKKIFQTYFDKLMEGTDIKESNFVDLKHAGCSEFNPIIDIDLAEEDNRRVTFFLFDKKRLPQFPCSNSYNAPCKKQSAQFNQDKSTFRSHKSFSCAFYDSIARYCDEEVIYPNIIAFDDHMHFMSGHCTPLPLLWNQVPGKPKVRRSYMDSLGWAGLRYTIAPLKLPKISGVIRGTRMQRRSTLEIADIGIAQNDAIYAKTYKKLKKKNSLIKVLTPMIPMPMDMSYAHIDGYKGVPIYQRVTERKYFIHLLTVYTGEHEEIITEKINIWPDDVCKNRDDLMSEANAKKRFGKDIVIQTESFGTEGNRKKGLEGFYFFWARKSQLDDEDISFLEKYDAAEENKKREPVWLHPQEMDLFIDWAVQREDTMAAAIKHPFRYMPMYHYEPRRWSALDNPKPPETKRHDSVKDFKIPFDDIATPKRAGVFVGFKMYTALGYKPLDPQLKNTLTEFYNKCQEESIPIMCHCSPSGMYSHDRELYFMRESNAYRAQYSTEESGILLWEKHTEYQKTSGFYDEFVRPSAWRDQVMKKYPKLRLCLAHFGGGSSGWKDWKNDTYHKIYAATQIAGAQNEKMMVTKQEEEQIISDWYMYDKKEEGIPKPKRWIREMVEMLEEYENFYTDISYHFLENHKKQFTWLLKMHPKIREKIMFGSDWYMTELDNWSLEKFVKHVKHSLDQVSKELEKETGIRDDLFLKFSRINPMKFYRVRSIADNLKAGLENGVDILNKKITIEPEDSSTGNSDIVELNETELNNHLKIIKQSDLY